MDNAFHHVPVLFDEVMQWMAPRPDGVYLDGTLGGGGHSEGILRLSGGAARLQRASGPIPAFGRFTATFTTQRRCSARWTRRRSPARWWTWA